MCENGVWTVSSRPVRVLSLSKLRELIFAPRCWEFNGGAAEG